jgi:nucleotide-binding universal stress UspA family protein
MKILIAYDGSGCADEALDDLLQAGLPADTQALVVSVAEKWFPPPSSYEVIESVYAERFRGTPKATVSSHIVEDAQEMAFQASKIIQSSFPSWSVHSEASTGSPSDEIIKCAEKWGADLIVVGSHGHSWLGQLVLGSVSQKVVTEARCSVRIARNLRGGKGSPLRILLGVDGSVHSGAAVKEIASRTWPKGSQVRLVTSLYPLSTDKADAVDKYISARNIHESAETFLSAAGLVVSSVLREEDAKHLLVKEAESWGADSIFIGARGLGRLIRLLLGSVSTAVVSRAHCTVEVVRAPKID